MKIITRMIEVPDIFETELKKLPRIIRILQTLKNKTQKHIV